MLKEHFHACFGFLLHPLCCCFNFFFFFFTQTDVRLVYDLKFKNMSVLEQIFSWPSFCGMSWRCISISGHRSFLKAVQWMEQFIINLAGIRNEKESPLALRPWTQYVNLQCGCDHDIPAATVSPIVIFLLINKFELARNPKF